MAQRKVSHHGRIVSKKSTTVTSVKPGNIIEFIYRNKNKDNYDKNPLVFVLSKPGKVLNGINIGYLKEFVVERLLKEQDMKRLKHYSLYEGSFRTYSKTEMKMIKLIEFRTQDMQRQENKIARAQGKDDEVEL
tara:strand:+ start:535 stop:933 length:399 start_codon:yes stop_codon:yes gene_type:complete